MSHLAHAILCQHQWLAEGVVEALQFLKALHKGFAAAVGRSGGIKACKKNTKIFQMDGNGGKESPTILQGLGFPSFLRRY